MKKIYYTYSLRAINILDEKIVHEDSFQEVRNLN